MSSAICKLQPFDVNHFELRPAVGTWVDTLPDRPSITTLGWREGALERFLCLPAHARHFAQFLDLPWVSKAMGTDRQRETIVLRQVADIDLMLVNPGQRALL
jgi:hypothetical protein